MYIVDRIEDNIVVLEDYNNKNIINVDIKYFNTKPVEGNVFTFDGFVFIKDTNKEKERRNKIEGLFNKLKNNN